ncbi:hypothetical protein NEUTE1DRAFT_139399 [Neurospora tetrasperma FGSC 2508]|uniref:Uncharacterized protein n=1 Tax=Neurospora tetrasperma (strain FGSC 2508 / ATCC MYA-4615 / P0657) TaxID=510951 RepID=F8MSU7_NEUT8|nr:uncharacterized protein NEUTE1DRAFT_139399 [Neurospora tetrasperma FGSC 2508]EGO55130.1 hypothetical protein NEUTE1DRAFT_139399 [Neurospora tetrasperma FGSC 2508]EGZ69657.1 hypothetical protein NEUTE2DRAFT_169252 [Neurospora tetrasperma FGSC 2509]
MDISKDIIPNMADKTGRQDDSSDVIATPYITSLQSVSVHHHRRDSVSVKSDPPSTHTHHTVTTHHPVTITTPTTTTFNDNTANWRELSQPRARRLIARHGTTYTSLTKLGSSGRTTSLHHILGRGRHEEGAQDMSGSELRMHFASLDKTAVATSIEERIRSVEVELNRLREEREKMVRELGDKMERADVDER